MFSGKSKTKKFIYTLLVFVGIFAVSTGFVFSSFSLDGANADTVDTTLTSQWFASSEFLDVENMLALVEGLNLSEQNQLVIAVIDTGIMASHPIYEGLLVEGYNVLNDTTDVADDTQAASGGSGLYYHGTHVAGIIAQFIRAMGLQNNIKIMPIKAGDKDASFSWSNVAKAINYAAEHGASIINMSLAGTISGATTISNLTNAVKNALAQNCVSIAAAGNKSSSVMYYPAAVADVVGVMAYASNNHKWSNSNYNAGYDIIAPGANINSSYGLDGYSIKSGTSMACPIVSFMAAVLMLKYNNATTVKSVLKGYEGDTIAYPSSNPTYQFKKADLGKMLSYVPSSHIQITSDAQAVNNTILQGLTSSTAVTFNAKLYYKGDNGQLVERPTNNASFVWTISENGAVISSTLGGGSFTLPAQTAIGNYTVTASPSSDSSLISNGITVSIKVNSITISCNADFVDGVIYQTLGSFYPLNFVTSVNHINSSGENVSDDYVGELTWYIQKEVLSGDTVYWADYTNFGDIGHYTYSPSIRYTGKYRIYASLLNSEIKSNYITFKIGYAPTPEVIEVADIKNANFSYYPLRISSDENFTFSLSQYENCSPSDYSNIIWYIGSIAANGEITYKPIATGVYQFTYNPTEDGRYVIMAKNGTTTVYCKKLVVNDKYVGYIITFSTLGAVMIALVAIALYINFKGEKQKR